MSQQADGQVHRVEVAIVGSGFSGLCMAIRLKQAGIDDFLVLERAQAVGGTWRDNHYPGCACDIPSHLYSYSFAPNPGWSRVFAPQPEISAYLERCADSYRVRSHIRFGTTLRTLSFDEQRGVWHGEAEDGFRFEARAVVLALGALSNPAVPRLPGLERFRGRQFHSARWDHGYDLGGKSVAVVGTGASAIQFVPQIQPRVARLHLFQRTAPWVLPKPDRAFTPTERLALARVPGVRRLYRESIYWQLEARALCFVGEPRLMRLVESMARRHIERAISDPELRRRVTPDYRAGCKRLLLSNDYYPSLARPNVEVLTGGVAEVREHGVVTADGREIPVDALIFGTGFDVHDYLKGLQVAGRGGERLEERWRHGAEAYLGSVVSGFPNLFVLMGPNTGLGHNSMVYMIEAQVDYALQHIQLLREHGVRFADVRPAVQARYNQALQKRLQHSIWSSGCASWYLDEQGRNTTLWPGFTFEFRARTRRLRAGDYQLVQQA